MKIPDESNEVLDLVDKNDQLIGTILRKDEGKLFETNGQYIRFANCFIRNSQGQLWIPRRTSHKKIAPNGLDFSASEHVKSGETYFDAVVRGLSEELKQSVDPDKIKEIGKLEPDDDRPYFSMIYLIESDSSPSYNPEDFVGYKWLSAKEVINVLGHGEPAKQDLLPAIRLLIQ